MVEWILGIDGIDGIEPYFITFTLVEWIPLFAIPEYASIVVASINYCVTNKGLMIFGYCIMPSHVHLIVQSKKNPLGSAIRDLKKYTSSQIEVNLKSDAKYKDYLTTFQNKATGIKRKKYIKVWLDGYHPEIIYSNQFFFQKLNYIHNNPLVASMVAKPEDFYYSSSRNYAGLDAPLDIIFESQQLTRF